MGIWGKQEVKSFTMPPQDGTLSQTDVTNPSQDECGYQGVEVAKLEVGIELE